MGNLTNLLLPLKAEIIRYRAIKSVFKVIKPIRKIWALRAEDYIIELASGNIETKADQLKQDVFIPWKRGVSL